MSWCCLFSLAIESISSVLASDKRKIQIADLGMQKFWKKKMSVLIWLWNYKDGGLIVIVSVNKMNDKVNAQIF